MKKLFIFAALLGVMYATAQDRLTLSLADSAPGVRKMEVPVQPFESNAKVKIPAGIDNVKLYGYHMDIWQYLFNQRRTVDTMSNKSKKAVILKLLKSDTTRFYSGLIKETINILSAYSKSGERLVYLDTDNDLDFTDETPLLAAALKASEDKPDKFIKIDNLEFYDYPAKTVKTHSVWVYPYPFQKDFLPEDSAHHLELVITHPPKVASLDSSHQLLMYCFGLSPIIGQSDMTYMGRKKDQKGHWVVDGFSEDGKNIVIGEWMYTVESIDPYGKSISLTKTPAEKPKEVYDKIISGTDVFTGNKVNTDGKILILDFWGTWCAPCKGMTPDLKKLYAGLDSNRYMILGVAYDADPVKVRKYLTENQVPWKNLFFKMGEPAGTMIDDFKITGFPTVIVLDPEKRILFRETGGDAIEKLEPEIRNMTKR